MGQHALDLSARVAAAWDDLYDSRGDLADWHSRYLPQDTCHLTWRVTDREGAVKVRRYRSRHEVVVDIPVTEVLGPDSDAKIVELLLLSQRLRAEMNETPPPPA